VQRKRDVNSVKVMQINDDWAGGRQASSNAAAQTGIVSVAGIRLDPGKFVRPFKGIFCDDFLSSSSHAQPGSLVSVAQAALVRAGPTSADRDAAFTVERFKFVTPIAEAPWRQLQLDKVGKSRSFICPVISDLRRLIRPSLPLPFPVNPLHLLGKYEPAGRRFFECALYPRILCSRHALFGLGRSLSVHIRTQRHTGRTPGKTARFSNTPNHAQAAALISWS